MILALVLIWVILEKDMILIGPVHLYLEVGLAEEGAVEEMDEGVAQEEELVGIQVNQ